ncbi:ADP-ribosylglycohydrolase family protein [Candidatus Woesearchaeota archaeon]|nr:ADP-ribosylglycohydrolase family protein [Candidatus Woesearchaeota archaeon]MBW3021752.1 ADP-ribosylglycohydrolase family protein [Candidatus Woesearchaeota archaeon]
MVDLDKVKGCIFGLAIGDALGAPVEFMTPAEIRKEHGILKDMTGGGWLNLLPGEFTDDTDMMLCIATSLIERKEFDIRDIASRYLDWMRTNPPDIGNTVRRALENLENGASPLVSGIPAPNEGNGSVMRCAPIGIAFCNSKQLETYSEMESSITHASAACLKACVKVNRMIAELVKGNSIKFEKTDRIENPSGWVKETMQAAFYALCNNKDFESTLIEVVNLGGDSDTTGAICGAIAGACYGFSSIPKRWLDKIHDYDVLEDISRKLHSLSETL